MKKGHAGIVLDTCTLSDLTDERRRRHELAAHVVATIAAEFERRGLVFESLLLPTIAVFESERGFLADKAYRRLNALRQYVLAHVEVVNFDLVDARQAAEMANRNPAHNDLCDILIASTAGAMDATFVTEDGKFRRWLCSQGYAFSVDWNGLLDLVNQMEE